MEDIQRAYARLDECLMILQGLSAGQLRDAGIQNRLQRIKYLPKQQSRRAAGRQAGTQAVACSMSKYNKDLTRAIEAIRRYNQDAPPCRPFSPATIELKDVSVLTLVTCYQRTTQHNTATLRILSILIAHAIDQKIETGQKSTFAGQLSTWATELHTTTDDIRKIEYRGRWYIDLLSQHAVLGAGALLMMGDHHSTFGCQIGHKHVLTFLTACREIAGFESCATELAPSFYRSLLHAIEACAMSVEKQSRLGDILAEASRAGMHQSVSPDRALTILLSQFDSIGVPKEFLEHAFLPQLRWNDDGARTSVEPPEWILRSEVSCFQDPATLHGTLEDLTRSAEIELDEHGIVHIARPALRKIQQDLPQGRDPKWTKLACTILCHVFPRGQHLNMQYRTTGRRLLPLLLHLCERQAFTQDDPDLIATLLCAESIAKHMGPKIEEHIDKRLKPNIFSYHHVWNARKRFQPGRYPEEAVDDIFVKLCADASLCDIAHKRRMNIHMGCVRASYGRYLCRYGSLSKAAEVVSEWTPWITSSPSELERTPWITSSPSELEQITQRRLDLVKAIILRYEGRDAEAMRAFQCLQDISFPEDGFNEELIANLIDLTPDSSDARRLASQLIHRDGDLLATFNESDNFFKEERFEQALAGYGRARDLAPKSHHEVRALVGIAKTSQRLGCDPLKAWADLEKVIDQLGWKPGFTRGLLDLSLGAITDNPHKMVDGIRLLRRNEAMWLVGGQEWVTWVCGYYRGATPRISIT